MIIPFPSHIEKKSHVPGKPPSSCALIPDHLLVGTLDIFVAPSGHVPCSAQLSLRAENSTEFPQFDAFEPGFFTDFPIEFP